ncbi:MAG: DinB family protein [Cyclobacteriaceae bacterium]
MKIKSEELIADLIERTKGCLNEAEKLKQLPDTHLAQRPGPAKWNALECLEHLNLYGDFYLDEIEDRMTSSNHQANGSFSSGWLGNYFAESMLPGEQMTTMNTFKSMNTHERNIDISAIDRFIHQQQRMLDLLSQARSVNLTKTKTGISITNLVKLRLGDTFRVVIYHNQRHIEQAKRAVAV